MEISKLNDNTDCPLSHHPKLKCLDYFKNETSFYILLRNEDKNINNLTFKLKRRHYTLTIMKVIISETKKEVKTNLLNLKVI